MTETESVIARKETGDEEEDDYNEEEDEDYQEGNVSEGENDDDDEDHEDKKEILKAKYDNIENAEGGLIKTRTQRAKEVNDLKEFKKAELAKSSVDIDSFWNEMNSKKVKPTPTTATEDKSKPEMIKIKSTYEFAGDIVTEDKWVPQNSAEAEAYLNSVKLTNKKEEVVKPVAKRGVRRKRPSLLDAVINDEKTLKLSTLEKSRLDWSSYVDKNDIKDELKNNNKGGFLQKQDFLNRVQSKLDDQYKAAQQLGKK